MEAWTPRQCHGNEKVQTEYMLAERMGGVGKEETEQLWVPTDSRRKSMMLPVRL